MISARPPRQPRHARRATCDRCMSGNGRGRAERKCAAKNCAGAEIDSRARASSLKWQLDTCRRKLSEAAEETKEVRRTAKDALSLPAEVGRLEKLLSEAGVEPSKRGRISSVSKERRRLRAALEQAENQKDKIKSLRTGCGELRKEVTRLNKEVARLNKRQARETQASGHCHVKRSGFIRCSMSGCKPSHTNGPQD